MARVKIKCTNSKDPRKKHKLLEILSKNEIYATRIITVQDGFIVLTSDETEQDKLFNNKTDNELKKEDLIPQIPLELKASRSVLIFKVDNEIFNKHEEDIKEELERQNPWVGQILQTQKFTTSNIIKITFDETVKAVKATEKGLLAFSMRLPYYDIKVDTFYNITTCFRCYALEQHNTNNCDKDKNFKICSNCSTEGHSWKECKEKERTCINCGGGHSTMEMRCPKRKEIINKKRKEGDNNTKNYSEAVIKNTQITIPSQPIINTETHLKIYSCMLHAHFQNASKPGTYSTELNKLFRANNLPEIIIPSEPDSDKIISAITRTGNTEHTREEDTRLTMETEQVEEPRKTDTERKTSKTTQEKQHKITKGTDIGLKIYTPRTTGWPKSELTKKALVKGIYENKYKFTYLEESVEDEDIINMINSNSIDMTDCFSIIEDSTFNKIRTGRTRQRTPPPVPFKRATCRKNSL